MSENGINGEVNRQKKDVKWFTEGEFLWRTGASVAWLILCLPGALLAFAGVVSVNIFHPITWLSDIFGTLFAAYFWFVVIFYGIITGLLAISNNKFNSVEDVIHKNRVSSLLFLVYPHHLFHMFLYSVGGMFSTWFLLSINSQPFDSLTTINSESEEECFLNEYGVFVLTFGGWLGFYASLQYFSCKKFHFTFPVIQQRKFFRIKAVIWPCIYKAIVLTFKALRWYYPLYYLFGNIPRNLVAGFLVASMNSDLVPIDTVCGLMNLSLLWVVFSVGTLLSFVWILGNNLFIIFNTQAYQFPIESPVVQDKDKCLPVVIKTKNVPLLRYLAFLDLCQLSQFSSTRRKQIFCLTQPGGRPANWTNICEECLTMLNTFTADLNSLMEYQTQQRQQNSEPWMYTRTPTDKPLGSFTSPTITDTSRSTTPRTPLSSATPRPRLWSSIREENSSIQQFSSPKDTNATLQKKVIPEHKQVDTLTWKIKQIPHHLASFMRERPVIGYLFNEIPGSRAESLFADCQLQIWAVKGLSRLVVSSYTEDTFGVVQKVHMRKRLGWCWNLVGDIISPILLLVRRSTQVIMQTLSDILTTLLALLQALDRYAKFPTVGYQTSAIQPRPPRPCGKEGMRYNLRATLVSSLYHITNTFGQHLNGIPLSHEHRNRLQAFMENRE